MKSESIVVLEDTDEGILVRPAMVFPIERYSDKRFSDFDVENNEAIAKAFPPATR